ncbi:hypothetical protein CP556_21305 [Natrinema sp. CBA1119]|nr:hypothetical protein CP556_21305 [Natrinema sp. CBA1119]
MGVAGVSNCVVQRRRDQEGKTDHDSDVGPIVQQRLETTEQFDRLPGQGGFLNLESLPAQGSGHPPRTVCEQMDAGHSYTSIVSLSIMSDASATLYQLTAPVDVPAALDRQEIDYLTVQADRLLVIFRKAVINIEIWEGTLETTRRATIDVLDTAPGSAGTEDQLIDQFLEQLETATGTEWRDLSS